VTSPEVLRGAIPLRFLASRSPSITQGDVRFCESGKRLGSAAQVARPEVSLLPLRWLEISFVDQLLQVLGERVCKLGFDPSHFDRHKVLPAFIASRHHRALCPTLNQ